MFQSTLNPLTKSQQRDKNDFNNSWQGDEIQSTKSETTTRIMFHNIHHLPLQGPNGLESFIHYQSILQVDLQAFSEHCLDTTKFRVIQQAKNIIRNIHSSRATIQLDSSQEQAQNVYKPGGTGLLALGLLTSRLEPQGKGGDSLGRWSHMTFRRVHLPPVTVVSVYQVCQRPTNLLGNTAFHQQQRALHLAGRDIHPRKAFIEDLHQLLAVFREKNHDIILGGDFNESIHDPNSGVLHLATTFQLVDPFLHRFQHKPEFGTHINGRRRIDLLLVSPGILPGIQSIGYAPFDHSTPSDHRPLLVDITTSVFFGTRPNPIPSAVHRALTTKDTKAVTTYVNHLYDLLVCGGTFIKQANLDDDTASPETVEQLDRFLGVCEDQAEKKCHRRRPEYFSRQIVQQRFKVAILKCHLSALQRNQDRTTTLYAKMSRVNIQVPLPATQSLTRAALKSAQTRLQETSRASFELRQAELEQKIQTMQERKYRPIQKILRSIKKVEQSAKTFQTLKSLRHHNQSKQNLDRLEIPASWPPPHSPMSPEIPLEDPKTCCQWKTITDPQEVEYYIMLRNRIHFGQAQGTPFTIPPLQTYLDWNASTREAENTLNGSFTLTINSTPMTTELLQACVAVAPKNSIPEKLSMEEFRGKISTWRETTSTSPSGRHLGRYKVLFTKNAPEELSTDQEAATSFADKQDFIAQLKLSIMNYCIRHTYVLHRWRTVVNIMIFKDPGNFKIHRLRVIHLYEADFNALLAIKWRHLVRFAESTSALNEGQYGGRPGCEATSLPLLEELKYDISYLTRRSLFNFDNDASSCYDRIVVPFASLINRKYGQHEKLVALHASTLRQANFYLKTATGLSETTYSHGISSPIHGTGQGSGNSPSIWLLISSTLFDVHSSRAHGATFVSPDGTEKVQFSMVGFVDDSTGTCNDFKPTTQAPLNTLFQHMQADAQMWNDLLYTSGGKLELAKCSFHLLHFEFLSNGCPRPIIDQYNNRIYIQDTETQTRIPIPAKRVFDTHKTLGHHKSPQSHQPIDPYLHLKARNLSILIATSPLTRQGALLAYHTVFIPTIRYTLPQSFYSKSTLEKLQSESITRIIAKCGYNRHTARAIIYAPTQYAGGGFLQWYLLQGEGQILQFLKHWRSNTIISKTLRIAVGWAQWQSGHSIAILEDVHTKFSYLECRWLTSLRGFLAAIGAQIRVDKTFLVRSERQHDIHIMPYAIASGLFSDDDLKIINYCRLFLHVTTVSELLNADGRTMNQLLFHCHREPWFNGKTYVVLQTRPSDYQIRTKWQKLCRQWVDQHGNLAASLRMGKWTTPGASLRRYRETYWCNSHTPTLYHWRQGKYWQYDVSVQNSRQFLPRRSTEWTPTGTCVPITVQKHASGMIVMPFDPQSKRYSQPVFRPATTFNEYISRLAPWEQHLLTGIDFKYGPFEIVHAIQAHSSTCTTILVSDGSHKDEHITFGWVLGNSTGLIYAEQSHYGFGTPTSHRAEAWGALSGLLFLAHLQKYTETEITKPSNQAEVIMFSDNSGLISRIVQRRQFSNPYPNSTLAPDWDLVEQIYTATQNFQDDRFQCRWVKGHQEGTTDNLPVEAKFNIRADALAAQVRVPAHVQTRRAPWVLPSERCQLIIHQISVHSYYHREIRTAYQLPDLYQYLTRRHQWSPTTVHNIDWTIFTQAASTTTLSGIQLTKFIYDKLPTRYERSKAEPSLDPSCPYCNQKETFHHLLSCENPVSSQFREDLQERLNDFYLRYNLPSDFRLLLQNSLQYWIHPNCSTSSPVPNDIYESQSAIGWHLFPKGMLSSQWQVHLARSRRTSSNDTNRTAPNILVALVHLLWDVQYDMWTKHLIALGSDSNPTTRRYQDRREDYMSRIRLLHSRQHLCLASHRSQFFYEDLENFLTTATLPQMKAYLLHYEPAIEQSIKRAGRTTSASLLSFLGFTRQRRSDPLPIAPPNTVPTRHKTPVLSSPPLEGTKPHKHSKWKTRRYSSKSIKTYFSTHPP